MNVNVEIAIPKKGKLIGTTGWVKEQLKKMDFKITNSKSHNVPCVVYKRDGEEKWHIAVKPITKTDEDGLLFYNEYGDMYIEHPQDPSPDVFGMFKYLTPAAYEYVEVFIKKLANELEKAIEEESVACDVEIKIK